MSVLDQSPIAEGSTGAHALRNTIDMARLADARGYHRYWIAEHHGTPSLACATCDARRYLLDYGIADHRNCLDNFVEALSACPQDQNPVNGFRPKDLLIELL